MDTLDKIAGEVLLRHTCHCDAAVEKPAPHRHDEHVFKVDGEDFPWWVSERGPIVTRLRDDLYSIDVEIFLLSRDNGKFRYLDFGYAPLETTPFWPVINGKQFPWLLDEHGWELKAGHKMIPTIHLAFFAHTVTGNYPIEDQRPRSKETTEAVWCAGGDLIADGKQRCCFCSELVDDCHDHLEQAHPERVKVRDGQKSYEVYEA